MRTHNVYHIADEDDYKRERVEEDRVLHGVQQRRQSDHGGGLHHSAETAERVSTLGFGY
jgi:hypothetical protein